MEFAAKCIPCPSAQRAARIRNKTIYTLGDVWLLSPLKRSQYIGIRTRGVRRSNTSPTVIRVFGGKGILSKAGPAKNIKKATANKDVILEMRLTTTPLFSKKKKPVP
jgi:hypothetical protein